MEMLNEMPKVPTSCPKPDEDLKQDGDDKPNRTAASTNMDKTAVKTS